MTEGRTVAVGDVHGCSAAPAALVRAIDPTAFLWLTAVEEGEAHAVLDMKGKVWTLKHET
jgi:hypothetical protein